MSERGARVLAQGVAASSAIDLLAFALARRPRDADATEPAAVAILRRMGLPRLTQITRADLVEDPSVAMDPDEAMRLLAMLELGRRSAEASRGGTPTAVSGDADAAALFAHLRHEDQEHFEAAFLDVKNGVISQRTLHIGTTTMSVVGVREVFREALREGAVSIIVAHNHPSGDPEPSPEDIDVTRRLAQAGELLDVALLDHVIIGRHRHVSLRQRGLMPAPL